MTSHDFHSAHSFLCFPQPVCTPQALADLLQEMKPRVQDRQRLAPEAFTCSCGSEDVPGFSRVSP